MFKVTLREEIAELLCVNFLKMIECCGIYTLFYQQHFHKQRQAENGKKLSKS